VFTEDTVVDMVLWFDDEELDGKVGEDEVEEDALSSRESVVFVLLSSGCAVADEDAEVDLSSVSPDCTDEAKWRVTSIG
jgi:hypothetical protein